MIHNRKIPASSFSNIITSVETLTTLSQLLNIMARVKAWSDERLSSLPPEVLLDGAVQYLKDYLAAIDDNSKECSRISFMLEQIKLGRCGKYTRHYSTQLIILSYLLNAASPAAYDYLLEQDILLLPSVETLGKVTIQLNSNTGLDNSSYLRLRIADLNEYKRTVLLIIDEIYVAKRVEYSGGEVQGLTPDGAVASTLLCFMVKFLASKYKDIVAIYPIATLNAAMQYECFKEVQRSLTAVGLYVVAISVDNASTNR